MALCTHSHIKNECYSILNVVSYFNDLCRISKPVADYIADSVLEIGCKAIYQQLNGLMMVLVHGTFILHQS